MANNFFDKLNLEKNNNNQFQKMGNENTIQIAACHSQIDSQI